MRENKDNIVCSYTNSIMYSYNIYIIIGMLPFFRYTENIGKTFLSKYLYR